MSRGATGVKISTGIPDQQIVADIDSVTDDTLSIIARTSKYELTMPQVMSFVDGERSASAVLLAYHRAKINGKPPLVCPVNQGVRSYQYNPVQYDPGAKPSVVAFMSPIIHGAFAPDITEANEEQCVAGRINNVRSKLLPMGVGLSLLMTEFAKLLISDSIAHTLDPEDYDTVRRKQDKPTQRATLARSEVMDAIRKVDLFMKKECYANVKDPRPISQINGVDKREYSMFMYAFSTILKVQDWYAFGTTPLKIADRVVKICSTALTVTKSDFERFDGHGSNIMRELERICVLRAFRHKYVRNW
jgi:hypothetical protein